MSFSGPRARRTVPGCVTKQPRVATMGGLSQSGSTPPNLPWAFVNFRPLTCRAGRGGPGSAHLQDLLDAVTTITIGPGPTSAEHTASPKRSANQWWLIAPALFLVLLIAGYGIWRLTSNAQSVPLVAVTAADQSLGSQAWARDVLVKLSSLQAADADELRLVDKGSDTPPELILEVGGVMQPDETGATLVLRSGKDRTLLWSKDFQQPAGRIADLKQQLAHVAAQVLRCAVEGMRANGKPLSQQLQKLYLSGCSAVAETDNLEPLRPLFLEITQKAPSFQGAWSKLLKIEARMAALATGVERSNARQVLQRHITEARKVNPYLTEAYLAEAELLPGTAKFERMALLDQAIARNPENTDASRSTLAWSIDGWADQRCAHGRSPCRGKRSAVTCDARPIYICSYQFSADQPCNSGVEESRAPVAGRHKSCEYTVLFQPASRRCERSSQKP